MPRGSSLDEVFRLVLAGSDSEEKYSPSDDDIQSSAESESAGAVL